MASFLIYDAKVAVLIVVFYMFYRLMLARETFHRVNRIVLLLTAVASFVLPLCVITMHETVVLEPLSPEFAGDRGLNEGMQYAASAPQPSDLGGLCAAILFFIGMVATLGYTLVSILKVLLLIRNSEKHPQEDGITLCVTGNADMAPFSFCSYIVMNRSDYEERDAAILAHERGHIRLHHSWDVLLVDLITALQWFNPAIWMLRQDLRAIHEYEADGEVLSQGINARQYQYLLISKATGIGGYSIVNGISHSTLKNRINMMLHKKSNRSGLLKLLALVPIVGITLALNARTVTDYVYDEPQKQQPIKKGQKAGTIKMGNQEIQVKEGNKPVTFQTVLVPNNYPMDGVPVEVVVNGNVIQTAKTDAKGKITLTVPIGSTVRFITNRLESDPLSDEVTETADIKEVVITKELLEKAGTRIIAFGVPTEGAKELKAVEQIAKPGKIFDVVEEMPQFPGGPQALFEFLGKTIKYPEDAEKAGVQGRVIITFVVETDGSISDARVVKSVSPSLDAEAIRVINAMPNWEPGKQNGEAIRVKYTVPITFRLGDGPVQTVQNQSTPYKAGYEAGIKGININPDETDIEVDGKKITIEALGKIDPKEIDHMDVLKKNDERPKNQILIFMKKNK